jgi:hypothetical protein
LLALEPLTLALSQRERELIGGYLRGALTWAGFSESIIDWVFQCVAESIINSVFQVDVSLKTPRLIWLNDSGHP